MNLFKTLFIVVVVALALTAGSQAARAQGTGFCAFPGPCTDVYTVDYFANANTAGAPDATVRIISPGVYADGDNDDPNADGIEDVCASIYVFDANQELSECCSCNVTPNALLTLSVNTNLTSNPLLGAKLKTGVIKIVAADHPGDSSGIPCDPTDRFGTVETLRAWATHIQNRVGTTFPLTEGESQAAVLGAGEYADLTEDCTVLKELGSGAGVCNCPAGH